MAKNKWGRPSVITPEVIRKLEEAFSRGCSDLEACLHADIWKTALYDYQRDHPEFAERKEKLKETTIMLARQTVVRSLKDNVDIALKYLERKKRDEFSTRSELTGKDGGAIETKDITENQSKAISILSKFWL